MAFLLPKKIPAFSPADSSSAGAATVAPANTQSPFSEDFQHRGTDEAPVTCCLHIKSPAADRFSFSQASSTPSRDAVLRRIRHHKRAHQIREAVRTHLAYLSDLQAAGGSRHTWAVDSNTFSPFD